MKKKTLLMLSFLFSLSMVLATIEVSATDYCYAKFNGEICDLNNPANCIDVCKVVPTEN